jgi:ribose 5-phosphate isomerase B
MKLALAADHAGFHLKEEIKTWLEENGHTVFDYGATNENPEDDYPDFIMPAARAVASGEANRAIVIGSSGQGEAMAANKIHGVRAVVYYAAAERLADSHKVGHEKSIIEASRTDNDSNVLAIGASFVSLENAKRVVSEWLSLQFSHEERHVRRIAKLEA